mmetsp:Transcript_91868/g.262764  ORF Transcript_91868/g.262764 Transcript_91868/m.262764 type:complete len:205 (-) Transcript_91868:191-805(-)
MNAPMPSFWSSSAKRLWKRRLSKRMPSVSGSSSAAFTVSLATATTGCEKAAIWAAMATASSTRVSVGNTRDTRPSESACSALMRLPVRIISMALALPIARIRRWVPPQPGMTPSLISGWPNLAFSPATIISHIMASSHPPPRAYPFTAAMTGLLRSLMKSQSWNMFTRIASPYVTVDICLISAPPEKNFSLPVITTAPTSASAS